jgi:LysM repeat protein
MKRIVSIVILGLLAASVAGAARGDFPHPRALDPDVTFWKRIYSEVGTDGGLIHDTHDLGLVYEVVKFPSRHGTDRHTENRKRYYQGILRSLAAGKRTGLSRDEQRVLALFGGDVTNARLRLASERIRFQLGQADKFRAGIIRSGAYMNHILSNLRDMNLPLEIANLPHVESSFTPNIYSRTGAAGLWQFMPATGRRFMRVDHIVDERLDPWRASIAAARLLEQNYRVTGSWPLAITAYNHGASGMRRAAQQLGTKDIARIVREYRSPTFGFASRNFYVEFLAATHVATNHEKYFGKLTLERPVDFESVTMPFYAKPRDLANALGVDVATLEKANPALRPGVWSNTNFVPKGYSLRVPSAALDRPLGEALAAMPNGTRYASQGGGSSTYVVRKGDTLSKIASRHGLSTQRLASLNGIRRYNNIRVGQRLKLPGTTRMAPMGPDAPAPKETVIAAAPPAPAPKPAPAPAEAAPSKPRAFGRGRGGRSRIERDRRRELHRPPRGQPDADREAPWPLGGRARGDERPRQSPPDPRRTAPADREGGGADGPRAAPRAGRRRGPGREGREAGRKGRPAGAEDAACAAPGREPRPGTEARRGPRARPGRRREGGARGRPPRPGTRTTRARPTRAPACSPIPRTTRSAATGGSPCSPTRPSATTPTGSGSA